MRNLLLSIAFATTALTAAAQAGTLGQVTSYYTYDFGGQSAETPAELTGSITINSNGVVTSGSIEGGGDVFNQLGSPQQYPEGYNGFSLGGSTGFLDLMYANPIPGATRFTLDSVNSYFSHGEFDYAAYGTFTLEAPVSVVPVSATPEPSSLILLGTGALGMAGAVRRRFFPRA